MKIYNKIICLAMCLCLTVSFSVSAEKKVLSPAITILSEKIEMKKCGVVNSDIEFSPKEFENALKNEKIEYITVKTLPDLASGVLKIANQFVLENQTISSKSLELLKFVPNENTVSNCFFSFCDSMDENSATVKCQISVLEGLNLAPETKNLQITTAKNISAIKSLKAIDPENDKLCFEITSFPKKGKVELTDKETGSFIYTPNENKNGKDSFCFTATDEFGNVSKVSKVTAIIENKTYDVSYDDMENHWGNMSALRLTDMGLMSGEKNNGKTCFNPDLPIARGDFLALAMIVTGNESNVNLCYATTFADDSSIPTNIKSYAETALAMGVVSGYVDSASKKIKFASERDITRSEAAVILNKLCKAPAPIINPKIVDSNTVPIWASSSINSLVSLGIINGNQNGEILPDGTLSRVQAAEMLCNTIDYLENKKLESKSEKNIFNLFGWFNK